MKAYKHKSLPALGDVAEQQVVDEFRDIERWIKSATLEFTYYIKFDKSADCATVEGAIPYYDCAEGYLRPSPNVYMEDTGGTENIPAIVHGVHDVYPAGMHVIFRDTSGAGIGGIGNPAIEFPTESEGILVVGTFDLAQWDNPATRRPVSIGGSKLVVDAGSSLDLRLPGVTANETGYSLQLANDGESVLAVENAQPDKSWPAANTSTGAPLHIGTGTTAWGAWPEGLSVDIPSGTEAGRAEIQVKVRVENDSDRTGSITVGISIDGVTPLADDQTFFTIPAWFAGALDLTFHHTMLADLTAAMTLAVWYTASGDHVQFQLITDASEGDHTLYVSISYGGSGGTPGTTNHQLLDNRLGVTAAHDGVSVSVDPGTIDNVTSSDVQGALEGLGAAIPAGTSGPVGWGGCFLNYYPDNDVGDITLTAGGGWVNVNINGHMTLMSGNSGVTVTGAGTIRLDSGTSPNMVQVHGLINVDAPGETVDADSWVKLRLVHTTDNVTYYPVGGESRAMWISTGPDVDHWCQLSASGTEGSPAPSHFYLLQMAYTGPTTIALKIRNMTIWLEYR